MVERRRCTLVPSKRRGKRSLNLTGGKKDGRLDVDAKPSYILSDQKNKKEHWARPGKLNGRAQRGQGVP